MGRAQHSVNSPREPGPAFVCVRPSRMRNYSSARSGRPRPGVGFPKPGYVHRLGSNVKTGIVTELRLPVAADAPALARAGVGAVTDLPDEAAQVLQLLVSELVTNVVRHSGLGPTDEMTVRVEESGHTTRVEVMDHGDRYVKGATGHNRGQGLKLVDCLSVSGAWVEKARLRRPGSSLIGERALGGIERPSTSTSGGVGFAAVEGGQIVDRVPGDHEQGRACHAAQVSVLPDGDGLDHVPRIPPDAARLRRPLEGDAVAIG
jgi:Histidine kinase-like ATPase domain